MTESRLPPLAVILGCAGLIPFLGAGLIAVRSDPSNNAISAMWLISYAAVVLAFLGGVHWGFVLEGAKQPSERKRLALGVVPSLVGWSAMLLGLVAQPMAALAVLIAAFIATAVVEGRGVHRDLVPRPYMIMRWGLTVIVVLVLTTVLGIRLFG